MPTGAWMFLVLPGGFKKILGFGTALGCSKQNTYIYIKHGTYIGYQGELDDITYKHRS